MSDNHWLLTMLKMDITIQTKYFARYGCNQQDGIMHLQCAIDCTEEQRLRQLIRKEKQLGYNEKFCK